MSILPFDVHKVLEGKSDKKTPSKVEGESSSTPKAGSEASIKKKEKMLAKLKRSKPKVKELETNSEEESDNEEAEEEKEANFKQELRMRKLASFIRIVHNFSGKGE